jgi:hypothetical protein
MDINAPPPPRGRIDILGGTFRLGIGR